MITAIRMPAVTSFAVLIETALASVAIGGAKRLQGLPDTADYEFPSVLADVAAIAALFAWTWLLLSGLAAAVVASRGQQVGPVTAVADRMLPAAARRVLLGLLGLGVLTAPACAIGAAGAAIPEAASAAAIGLRSADEHPEADPRLLEGLPFPDRPSGGVLRAADRRPERARVVVRRGDTLWGIVAHSLGPAATAEQVARTWPAWYAANRQVIGDDPDLILPGTSLRSPHWSMGVGGDPSP